MAKRKSGNGAVMEAAAIPSRNEEAPMGRVSVKPIRKKLIRMNIIGTSTLVQHKWSEKALKTLRDKHAGKKTRERDVRDTAREGEEATYRTAKGEYGIPAMALKSALISAAHKDLGIEKTLVKKALFLRCKDPLGVLPMECQDPIVKEDPVRVGQGGTDLRYRPYFVVWAVAVEWEIDSELLTIDDLVTLVDRAGFGVGIGEWRPEKGGDYGRFRVDALTPVQEVEYHD